MLLRFSSLSTKCRERSRKRRTERNQCPDVSVLNCHSLLYADVICTYTYQYWHYYQGIDVYSSHLMFLLHSSRNIRYQRHFSLVNVLANGVTEFMFWLTKFTDLVVVVVFCVCVCVCVYVWCCCCFGGVFCFLFV